MAASIAEESREAVGRASIEVSGLTKYYGDFRAVDGISFSVRPGEIVGFLGPNGAGKTTTMKILTCFMAANAGTARVAGFDVHDASDEVRRRIGYLPESVPLYEDMLVWDYLKFIAEVRSVPAQRREAAIRRVAELTGLGPKLGATISELSKGYRQRVGLAQAIIHEPEVVILDEPTSGLDPNQILDIRDVIKAIGREKTVIFSTHILQEVAAVCDRIIIIHHGRIVADGTLGRLKERLIALRPGLVARFEAGSDMEALARTLEAIEGVRAVHVLDEGRNGELVELRLEGADRAALRRALHQRAAAGEMELIGLESYKPSLEEVFRHYTGGGEVAAAEEHRAAHGKRQEGP